MRLILFAFIFSFGFENSFSQSGVWTWISGSDSIGSSGNFGVQGIPSINNHPPGCYEPLEWKDKQGNFWLYGGMAPTYSDLWCYSPLVNEWNWIKGNALTGQLPVYGTQGIPNPSNSPGERKWSSVTWVDTTGNLWLFGGMGCKNDLWKYDISSNQWAWMSGSTNMNASGIYGIQGVPSPLNVPGARSETCSGWTDSLNNLWLFAGQGYASIGSLGFLNDLWKYNISTNEWTFMKGSSSVNASTSWGIKGGSDPNNNPGGCLSYTKWKDETDNFWILGGGTGAFNTVWKYSTSLNEWTWMTGNTIINDSGIYNNKCLFDPINCPPARTEHRSASQDRYGMFWLFGGKSYPLLLNDLWVFDSNHLTWNWVRGSNINNDPGNYGIKGVSSLTNIPPARAGAVSWWGDDNNFYLFGGTSELYNTSPNFCDLWRFTPDTNCIPNSNGMPFASLDASNTMCPGTCADFINFSLNASIFQWSFPGAIPDTSTITNPTNICYPTPGSYNVQLIATNANGSDTLLLTNYITVHPQPAQQSIIQIGDTLFAIDGSSSYQWYFNGNVIIDATDYFYISTESGDYNVVVTDSNGCEVEAVINNVIAGTYTMSQENLISVFPTPGSEKLFINSSINIVSLKILDFIGTELFTETVLQNKVEMDIRFLSYGIYFLQVQTEKGIFTKRFIKE
jgi:hypothetical protein